MTDSLDGIDQVRGGTHRGFSLVELLVVVSIMAMLLAILLPSLDKARAVARTVKCASQEKQVSLALFSYAADNRDFLPYSAWRTTLIQGTYVPGNKTTAGSVAASLLFRCPLDDLPRPSDDRWRGRASYVGSIGWKPTTDPLWVPQTEWAQLGMFPANSAASWIRLSAAKVPGETILFMEMYAYTGYIRINAGEWQDSSAVSRGWSAYGPASVYHDGQANFAFVDGHVRAMRWTDTHAVGVINGNSLAGTGQVSLWNRR